MQSYFQYGILSVWKIMSDDYRENLHFFLKLQLECFSFLSCMGKMMFACFFFPPRFQHNAWYMVDAQYICWMIENKKQHQTISDINVSRETVFNSILKGSGLPKNLLLICSSNVLIPCVHHMSILYHLSILYIFALLQIRSEQGNSS